MVRQSTARSTRSRASRGRSRRHEATGDEQVQGVYQEMLEEAEARDPEQFRSDRPIKRRRVETTKAIPVDLRPKPEDRTATDMLQAGAQHVQTIYDSISEEESDVEWEDVDIPQPAEELPSTATVSSGNDETLQLTLGQEPEPRKKANRRKPVTAAEKKLRLDVHKVHILCLLAHVHLRNRWCNNEGLQTFLKKMLPKRIIALLNPDHDKPQFTRSTTFIDGLNQAGDIFNRRYQVTKPGLKRAHWAEDQNQVRQKMESIMLDAEIFPSQEDFQTQAQTIQGSRDFGAQLFCALLRSVAVEARLVCSLQPLPFSGTVKDMTPSKAGPQYIVISSDDHETSTDERQRSTAESPTPSRTRRLGRPEFSSRPTQSTVRAVSRPTPRESSYPVFWVEAFNEAVQKWVPIDPLVTKSLAKPSKFEPPASDPYNHMNYVIAFEDDASARDVTRRYAKAFNAKTRKLRVESTRNGDAWWNKALQSYEKPFLEDRDQLEISELTSKSAAEPMPRNIQDFKDHPIYALERHLNRNQVISPKRVIGHVGLSKTTAKSDNLEPVYRRSDVHIVRSADKWYRLGRDVKVGEQPLKHVSARRPKSGFASDEEEDTDETALYAEFQTEIYRPPPVVGGRIPRNVYGNLDVYVPSMVPPGAVHIESPEAARAARILGIDYADAVTGFDFKGRRGTAVMRGIVIAIEYQEALEEVLMGMADERHQAALEARTVEVLRFWRLFLVKLRIAERVKGYAAEDETAIDGSVSEMSVDDAEEAGGGFFPEPDQPTRSPPQGFSVNREMGAVLRGGDPQDDSPAKYDQEAGSLGGGFILDKSVEEEPAPKPNDSSRPLPKPATAGQTRNSGAPRYELVVVPNHPQPGTEEHVLTHEHEAPRELEGSSEKAPIAIDSSTNGDSKSVSVEFLSRPPSPSEAAADPPPQDSDSEIEKGSLMSEDPEDEDAFPEWLM
ncbi:uncharacterized protein N7459_001243 [Penicillium hispanicum]|uniref:uncharacterized protein n=1 Tax=Penicillium hispanicum TaxID=1080232 RepID=UPI002540DB31|nr:uncharacterized protein N7459_001243 [Penicillium hispanicum]KAJ5595035.1 hypothetical protein N7459_001243 [Penicillium hispanicum]